MGRSLTRQLGRIRLHALDAGMQRLDGGAMFGVVPKPLWERRIPPDERNRIPLALRCLLVETGSELVLIDTGVGNKEDAKFRDIYGIDNAGEPTALEDAIGDAGFEVSDVSVVINTHLHFDHAGGNTVMQRDGSIGVSFEGIRHVVQRREWEFAHLQNERIRASYNLRNFDPVHEADLFDFVEGSRDVVPGIGVELAAGHTPGHQLVRIESEGHSAVFVADLVPTTAHLPLPWIMGYDVEPLVTMQNKRRVLEQAKADRSLLIFEHDPEMPWGYLLPEEERPVLVDERPD